MKKNGFLYIMNFKQNVVFCGYFYNNDSWLMTNKKDDYTKIFQLIM